MQKRLISAKVGGQNLSSPLMNSACEANRLLQCRMCNTWMQSFQLFPHTPVRPELEAQARRRLKGNGPDGAPRGCTGSR
jgi:hypothetical protein